MFGAGLFLIALGVGGILYLIFARERLKRIREHEREMPLEGVGVGNRLLSEMPLGFEIFVRGAACLFTIGLGVWALAQ